jgi:hypothetical protein
MFTQPGQLLYGTQVPDALAELGYPRAAPTDDPLTHVQGGINLFVNEILAGFPRTIRSPGTIIFRGVRTMTLAFQYRKWDIESFLRQDTKRGPMAPFKHAQRTYERVPDELERRGFVTTADRDEVKNALAVHQASGGHGFVPDLTFRKAKESRDQVSNDLEFERAAILNDPASYALAPLVLGTPWDAVGGDSRADIQIAAWNLANHNNVQPDAIGVALSHVSFQAVQSDPTMIASLTAGGGPGENRIGHSPTAAQIKQYWGVGDVQVGDFFYSTAADPTTKISAYTDNAYLYLLRDALTSFDTSETSGDFCVDFDWNLAGGIAREPVFKDVEINGPATAWLYPFESWTTPRLVNSNAGYLVQNTKA